MTDEELIAKLQPADFHFSGNRISGNIPAGRFKHRDDSLYHFTRRIQTILMFPRQREEVYFLKDGFFENKPAGYLTEHEFIVLFGEEELRRLSSAAQIMQLVIYACWTTLIAMAFTTLIIAGK